MPGRAVLDALLDASGLEVPATLRAAVLDAMAELAGAAQRLAQAPEAADAPPETVPDA